MPFLRQPTDKHEPDASSFGACEVFYVPETGQIYEDYEKYLGGLVQKNQPIWSCKYSGKNGLTFWEALELELKTEELLDSFPEQWKAPILRMVQHSYDSPELIATQLGDFCKVHFLQGEYVRIDINSEVRYWGEVISAVHGMRPDGFDSSEYKVSLAAEPNGTVIGEASFVGTPPFTRLRNVPSKTLIKKFIRSCASRTLFPGSPWIVNGELVKRYGLKYELPAHLAEAALKAAKSLSEGSSTSSLPIPDEYPKADEELPVENALPVPMEIVCPLPFDKVLEAWMFCQAFSHPLRISPFSLKDFCSALEHDELPNPLLEAINVALLTPIARERKTRGQDSLANLYVKSALYRERDDDDDEDVQMEEESSALADHLDKIKWWDNPTGSWWVHLVAFLKEFADSCQLEKSHWIHTTLSGLDAAYVRVSSKGYLKFSAKQRLDFIHLMIKLVEVLPIIRQHVDGQLEKALEERKDRRQMDIDRNRLLKELADLERELPQTPEGLDPSQLKEMKRLEAAIRKAQNQETQMTKKSEGLFKEERKASSFRVSSLGSDRNESRYWWLDFHLLPGQIDTQGSNMLLVEDPKTGKWYFYDEEAQITALLAALNPKGVRELKLAKHLEKHLSLLIDSLRLQAPKPVEVPEKAEPGNESEEDDEDEEMVVVPRRRGRRPKLTRGGAKKQAAEATEVLPSFLRYKNTLALKK